MTDTRIAPENAEQAIYWNGPAGQKWVAYQSRLDATLDPLGLIAVDAADPRPGQRVLDIGCGCGATSLALAERVGPGGEVLGIDISESMLALARRRAGDRPGLQFIQADASVHDFADAQADLLFSRFGVMFFREPVKAFANLRRGLHKGGRLAFVCWRPLVENDWVLVPLRAAQTVISTPPPPMPEEPGPFAFADPARVHDILERAGFHAIDIAPCNRHMTFGSSDDFAAAVDFAMNIGPLGRMLGELDAAVVARIRTAVETALQAHRHSDGVHLGAAVWIVTAHNST